MDGADRRSWKWGSPRRAEGRAARLSAGPRLASRARDQLGWSSPGRGRWLPRFRSRTASLLGTTSSTSPPLVPPPPLRRRSRVAATLAAPPQSHYLLRRTRASRSGQSSLAIARTACKLPLRTREADAVNSHRRAQARRRGPRLARPIYLQAPSTQQVASLGTPAPLANSIVLSPLHLPHPPAVRH